MFVCFRFACQVSTTPGYGKVYWAILAMTQILTPSLTGIPKKYLHPSASGEPAVKEDGVEDPVEVELQTSKESTPPRSSSSPSISSRGTFAPQFQPYKKYAPKARVSHSESPLRPDRPIAVDEVSLLILGDLPLWNNAQSRFYKFPVLSEAILLCLPSCLTLLIANMPQRYNPANDHSLWICYHFLFFILVDSNQNDNQLENSTLVTDLHERNLSLCSCVSVFVRITSFILGGKFLWKKGKGDDYGLIKKTVE